MPNLSTAIVVIAILIVGIVFVINLRRHIKDSQDIIDVLNELRKESETAEDNRLKLWTPRVSMTMTATNTLPPEEENQERTEICTSKEAQS